MLQLTLLSSYPKNLPKPFIIFLNQDMTEEIASVAGLKTEAGRAVHKEGAMERPTRSCVLARQGE